MQISDRQTGKIELRCNIAASGGAATRLFVSRHTRTQAFDATLNATTRPTMDSVDTRLRGFKYADQ